MLSSRWLRSYEVGLANLADHSIAADVRVADVTDPTCMEDLSGRIDIITCNDVIEHVQDTSALLQSIRGCSHRLAPLWRAIARPAPSSGSRGGS